MDWTRKIAAALAGATVALAPGVLGACYTVFGPTPLNPDGTPDNPPLRGAAFFLLASPLLFAVVSLFYGLSIHLLHRAVRLSLFSLCAASLAATTVLWVWLVVRAGEISIDGTVETTIVSTAVAAVLLFGSLASWIVLRRVPNEALQPTRPTVPRG